MIETVEEKIRNKVSPFWNIAECLKHENISCINKNDMSDIIKKNCEYLIKMGNIVDKYLPEGFDINKMLEEEKWKK